LFAFSTLKKEMDGKFYLDTNIIFGYFIKKALEREEST
jgi:hypothetical protein